MFVDNGYEGDVDVYLEKFDEFLYEEIEMKYYCLCD